MIRGILAGLLMIGCGGCFSRPDPFVRELQAKNDALSREVDRLERALAPRDAQIASLERQVKELTSRGSAGGHGPLFPVAGIEFARLTGGRDYDGKAGDDGVTVYLRPVDADGSTIKTGGDITIQLMELPADGAPKLYASYEFTDPDALKSLWQGGMLGDHYTLKLPWENGVAPEARRMLIAASFTDYQTGRTFRAEKVVELGLLGGSGGSGGGDEGN